MPQQTKSAHFATPCDFQRDQTQMALAISFFPVCEDDLDTSKRGRLSVI